MRVDKRSFSTDRELKALKPGPAWRDVKDGKSSHNLFVRVGPEREGGEFSRTFVMIARFPGSKHPTRRAIGDYRVSPNNTADLTLEDARAKAAEWHSQIRKGIDPAAAGRKRAEEEKRSRDLAFGSVLEEYLKRHVKGQRKAADVERVMRRELVEREEGGRKVVVWKDKAITEITKRDVVEVIEAIADRPAPYQAHNVFAYIRGLFNWAINRDIYGLTSSPADRVRPAKLIGRRMERQRVLTDVELFAYLRAADRLGYPFGPLFRLLAITGQRKAEVSDARWREFDLGKKLWTVPPERFKSDASHMVPLSEDALAVLEDLPEFKKGDHLFTTTFGERPVSGFSKAKMRLDARMRLTLRALTRRRGEDGLKVELDPFVIHDVRRTVRTGLSALRVPEPVAEMVIGHGKKGLARVYDQHRYETEMREALEAWAGRLREIVTPAPSNVVPIRSASK